MGGRGKYGRGDLPLVRMQIMTKRISATMR